MFLHHWTVVEEALQTRSVRSSEDDENCFKKRASVERIVNIGLLICVGVKIAPLRKTSSETHYH